MSNGKIVDELVAYISAELLGLAAPSAARLGPDDDLLGSGTIDSLGVMRLVSFVEAQFGVAVPAGDVTIEHFISVAAIAAYLRQRGVEDGH